MAYNPLNTRPKSLVCNTHNPVSNWYWSKELWGFYYELSGQNLSQVKNVVYPLNFNVLIHENIRLSSKPEWKLKRGFLSSSCMINVSFWKYLPLKAASRLEMWSLHVAIVFPSTNRIWNQFLKIYIFSYWCLFNFFTCLTKVIIQGLFLWSSTDTSSS